MAGTFKVRRYSAVASIAGGAYGVVLGLLSACGAISQIDPLVRGLTGVLSAALIGVLVSPLGVGLKSPLSKGVMVESALASALSTMVTWPVVYAMLS